ncbi:hypothetical protein D3C72_1873660 [compost metagenome]
MVAHFTQIGSHAVLARQRIEIGIAHRHRRRPGRVAGIEVEQVRRAAHGRIRRQGSSLHEGQFPVGHQRQRIDLHAPTQPRRAVDRDRIDLHVGKVGVHMQRAGRALVEVVGHAHLA